MVWIFTVNCFSRQPSGRFLTERTEDRCVLHQSLHIINGCPLHEFSLPHQGSSKVTSHLDMSPCNAICRLYVAGAKKCKGPYSN